MVGPRATYLTNEEMIAARLKPYERDYCAHLLLAFRKCLDEHAIPAFFCSDQKHKYLHCKENDQLYRMKEYERERRLLHKQEARGGFEAKDAKSDER
ncbi:unnamed protein product [Schistosoma curassoni]|uniref:NADH dehydrogenase [ubiquinone] 1 beta subcomplex subunit 7 n=1 Tax=Schistosoma curassoni TaxID=6186 RepID=A0A183JLV5_9TREM|nr:unnamed protein product [Schistosoma curassoni]